MSKRRSSNGPVLWATSLIVLLVGVVLLGMGQAKTLELRRLPGAEARSAPTFPTSAVGRTVVLTGTIASEKDEIEIYQAELQKIREAPKGKDLGDVHVRVEWDVETVHSPAFRLRMDDGVVPIVNPTYRLDQPLLLEEDGGLRFRGFAPGDTVLVVGATTHDGILATTVSGASFPTYLRRLRESRDSDRTWGSLWIGFGLLFAGFAWFCQRQQNRLESAR